MQCNGYSPHLGCGIGVQFAHLPLRISYSLILYFNKLIKLGGNIIKSNHDSIKYGCLKCVYSYIISPKLGNGAIYCSNLKKSTKIFVDWNGPININFQKVICKHFKHK